MREEERVRLRLGIDAGLRLAGAVEQTHDGRRIRALHDVTVNLAALGGGEDFGLADLVGRGRDDANAGVAVGVHEA